MVTGARGSVMVGGGRARGRQALVNELFENPLSCTLNSGDVLVRRWIRDHHYKWSLAGWQK